MKTLSVPFTLLLVCVNLIASPYYEQFPRNPAIQWLNSEINGIGRLRQAETFILPQNIEVTRVTWWGICLSDSQNTAVIENVASFTIQVFENSPEDRPGMSIYTQTIPLASVNRQVTNISAATDPALRLLEFAVDLGQSVALTADTRYWFSIAATMTYPSQAYWAWAGAEEKLYDGFFATDVVDQEPPWEQGSWFYCSEGGLAFRLNDPDREKGPPFPSTYASLSYSWELQSYEDLLGSSIGGSTEEAPYCNEITEPIEIGNASITVHELQVVRVNAGIDIEFDLETAIGDGVSHALFRGEVSFDLRQSMDFTLERSESWTGGTEEQVSTLFRIVRQSDQQEFEGTLLPGQYFIEFAQEITDSDMISEKTGRFRVKLSMRPALPPPVNPQLKIRLNGENPTVVRMPFTYVEPGAVATGPDSNITLNMTGNVDSGTSGTYTIAYEAQDASGNLATASRIVIVAPLPNSGTEYQKIHYAGSNVDGTAEFINGRGDIGGISGANGHVWSAATGNLREAPLGMQDLNDYAESISQSQAFLSTEDDSFTIDDYLSTLPLT